MILSNLHNDVSGDPGNEICIVPVVTPEVPRDESRQDKAEDRHDVNIVSGTDDRLKISRDRKSRNISLVLESQQRIGF